MAARPPISVTKNPFYIQVTKVKEDFTNETGAPASVDLPLVTLPAGTVLFRGLKIPNPSLQEDIRYFYRDFLGNPEAAGRVCLSPVHNVFFYPFPYVAFGAHDIGKTFNMMQAVVLVHPVTVVCAISPSEWVRGMGQRYNGSAPWQRCSNFSGPGIDCHQPTYQELEARTYDNCLHPDYQARSSTRGWMALADLDSINPKKKQWGSNKPMAMKDSPMGSFLKTLEGQLPGEGAKAVAWAYTDDHRHAGFPEIAMYPYKNHKGRQLIVRQCSNNAQAMRLIEKEAADLNLNYLPLAAFTKNGVVDMVNADFSYNSLGVTPNAFATAPAQQAILQHVYGYMNKLQKSGISLPFYGDAKLTFDTRTGFFVLDKVVPQNLAVPIPRPILNAEKAAGQNSKFNSVPYRFLLHPLITPEEERRALSYMLMFRSYLPEHFMEKYAIEPKAGMRRAMIFNRFPVLSAVFKELELAAPKSFLQPLNRAGRLYRKEMGIEKKPKAAPPAAETSAPPPITVPQPPQATATNEVSAQTPPYMPATPTYGATEGGPLTPTYGAMEGGPLTPPLPGSTPPPPKGGRRSRHTRRAKAQRRKTRRLMRGGNVSAKEDATVNTYASMFRNVWKTHAKNTA